MEEPLWYFQHKETTQPSFCQSNLLIYRFLSEQPFHFHGQQDESTEKNHITLYKFCSGCVIIAALGGKGHETAHCQSKCRL